MGSDDLEEPTQESVREVLRHVALSERLREDHAEVADVLDDDDLTRIADLAWRHQFDEDRSAFKRDLGELQQYVARKKSDG